MKNVNQVKFKTDRNVIANAVRRHVDNGGDFAGIADAVRKEGYTCTLVDDVPFPIHYQTDAGVTIVNKDYASIDDGDELVGPYVIG